MSSDLQPASDPAKNQLVTEPESIQLPPSPDAIGLASLNSELLDVYSILIKYCSANPDKFIFHEEELEDLEKNLDRLLAAGADLSKDCASGIDRVEMLRELINASATQQKNHFIWGKLAKALGGIHSEIALAFFEDKHNKQAALVCTTEGVAIVRNLILNNNSEKSSDTPLPIAQFLTYSAFCIGCWGEGQPTPLLVFSAEELSSPNIDPIGFLFPEAGSSSVLLARIESLRGVTKGELDTNPSKYREVEKAINGISSFPIEEQRQCFAKIADLIIGDAGFVHKQAAFAEIAFTNLGEEFSVFFMQNLELKCKAVDYISNVANRNLAEAKLFSQLIDFGCLDPVLQLLTIDKASAEEFIFIRKIILDGLADELSDIAKNPKEHKSVFLFPLEESSSKWLIEHRLDLVASLIANSVMTPELVVAAKAFLADPKVIQLHKYDGDGRNYTLQNFGAEVSFWILNKVQEMRDRPSWLATPTAGFLNEILLEFGQGLFDPLDPSVSIPVLAQYLSSPEVSAIAVAALRAMKKEVSEPELDLAQERIVRSWRAKPAILREMVLVAEELPSLARETFARYGTSKSLAIEVAWTARMAMSLVLGENFMKNFGVETVDYMSMEDFEFPFED